MSRLAVICLAGGVLVSVAVGLRLANPTAPEPVFQASTQPLSVAPMCPWRDPEADLKRLFPGAARCERETRILSGLRSELALRLGRLPTADENAVEVFRVFRDDQVVGEVTTRRVKGTFGAIELVLAQDGEGKIAGLLLQRLREPAAVAEPLQSVEWRQRFHGKSAGGSWELEELLAGLPEQARASGRAIVEGVRSTTVLLEAADRTRGKAVIAAHNH
jgi:hypothetical protein